ncbi:conserved hypothetical protein, partial [gamma proteobacterium HTCC5015]
VNGDKNLVGKIAGNDDVTDHKDWDNGGFKGWEAGIASPDALIQDWFSTLADNAAAENGGTARDFDGEPLEVYHTDDGLDLKQLVQKFLLGAVAFSQAADDYLDDDTEGKGLLAENTRDEDSPYTSLEHQFDEGFGYFGAARDYNDYTDEEIAGKGGRPSYASGYHDSNDDGMIDLLSEFNFGNSTNAGKRDLGSTTGTDYSKGAFDAFLAGRAIISNAEGELSDSELDALREQRDLILDNWEKAIAATVVQYINDTLGDMDKFGTADYSYADHTKHWGELKGFALGLQFNPHSALSDADFNSFHAKVGTRPVLPSDAAGTATPAGDIADYRTALEEARDILQAAYDFAADDVTNW